MTSGLLRKLLRFLYTLFFLSYQIAPSTGQDQSCPVDQSWCSTLPNIQSLCTNTQYMEQLEISCPRLCGFCGENRPSDDDRCRLNNGGCEHTCTIQNDQVECRCPQGYELTQNNRNCTDTNECANGENPCRNDISSPICINQRGSYFCTTQNCSKENDSLRNRYSSPECCQHVAGEVCGADTSIESRIVGGERASLGAWPWMVYILVGGRTLCGGTLISKSWVVTAGHCFSNTDQNTTVEAFFGRIRPYQEENHVQERTVDQVILHPDWSEDEFPYHDIALMHLSSPVETGNNVNTACLPNGERPAVGLQCWVTGYGTTSYRGSASDALLEVNVLIQDMQTCKNAYKGGRYEIADNIMFCAGHREGGRDSCQGDSGGPLVCQRCTSCQWYLAGIVSFGRGCARADTYGVYTDVEYYEEWISQNTGINVFKNKGCGSTSWTEWTFTSECTVTCGGGTRGRSRSCRNGNIGDAGCQGSYQETVDCNQIDCPRWEPFGPFTNCTVTCGGGRQERVRECINGNPGDIGCHLGSDTETQDCNTLRCPSWTNWGNWQPCSRTCEQGVRTSNRTCNTFGANNGICEGNESRTEVCIEGECPVWESWQSWSRCNQSCDGGMRSRRRTCRNGSPGEIGCHEGTNEENESCNTFLCGTWSDWVSWQACSVTCGGGREIFRRRCTGGTPGQGGCIGRARKTIPCQTRLCPVWDDWGSYSSCSKTCGGGMRTRTRTCLNGEPGDVGCEGSEDESLDCNTQDCPFFTDWNEWSECSTTCGGGIRQSSRDCQNGVVGDVGCFGETDRTETCNEQYCPVWSEFDDWSTCSKTCGGGMQNSYRTCINGTIGQVGCEGPSQRNRTCNDRLCPTWGEWMQVGTCSKTCDNGTIIEIRECQNGLHQQLGCIGPTTKTTSCLLEVCPTSWSEWTPYSFCSVTCGSGIQFRTRTCEGGENPSCPGNSSSTKVCGEPCVTRWGEWQEWGECSKNCSGGLRRRQRECIDGSIGDVGCRPESDRSQTRVCNEEACPECVDLNEQCRTSFCVSFRDYSLVNCQRTCNLCNFYQQWSEWGTCSTTCGYGHQERTRQCFHQTCVGSPVELRACNENVLCSGFTEWSNWSMCSVTCKGGTRNRSRECPPGENCLPDQYGTQRFQNETCQTNDCPGMWGSWSNYSNCSVDCGNGKRTRNRTCFGGTAGGPGCDGSAVQTTNCSLDPCPGNWSEWVAAGSCSTTCPSTQRETRTCQGGIIGGPGCIGDQERFVNCTISECVVKWQPWTEWTTCSVTCGSGERNRTRVCDNGEPGDRGCRGNPEQTRVCNITCDPCLNLVDIDRRCGGWVSLCQDFRYFEFLRTNCARTCCVPQNPQTGEWSEWVADGSCSTTCGPGTQRETRTCQGGIIGGPGCIGDQERFVDCEISEFVVEWQPWTEWTTCSAACGSGERRRTRICDNGCRGNDRGCRGNAEQTRVCNTEDCETSTIPVSTTVPDQCFNLIDLSGSCSNFASLCDIQSYADSLLVTCPRTCCEFRNRQSTQNNSDDCRDLQLCSVSFCIPQLQSFVTRSCRQTCGYC